MHDLKQLARVIFGETLAGIDIPATMQARLPRQGSRLSLDDREIDLAAYSKIRVVAMGKAAVAAARGFAEAMAPEIDFTGIVAAPHSMVNEILDGGLPPIPYFEVIGAGHPLPDEGSLRAAREILELLEGCDARTLVFFLLTGGGSTLVELPLDPALGLSELREFNRLLVGCGATIDEINAVRKHLSAVKGGRLAAAAPAAMKISLGITDVPVGCESALCSGPTIPDPTTVADACRVIDHYSLRTKLPAAIAAVFARPERIAETPKAGDPAFARAHFQLLLGMHDLFHHAHQAAEGQGFVTECDNSTDDWPLAEAADYLLSELARLSKENPGRRVALIADGEVRSPVTGDGLGGRNSALVLDCVTKIAGRNIAVLSAGTDGQDGSSTAAGAVADGHTQARAHAAGLSPADYFLRSDSYHFFKALDDTVETGPTGNNLRDLRLFLAE